jgi:hypothetical protein
MICYWLILQSKAQVYLSDRSGLGEILRNAKYRKGIKYTSPLFNSVFESTCSVFSLAFFDCLCHLKLRITYFNKLVTYLSI